MSEPSTVNPDEALAIVNKAIDRRVARGGIVVAVARAIDPAAFSTWVDGTEPNARPLDLPRRRCQRAAALVKAERILKLVVGRPNLAEEVVEEEVRGWLDLGVPALHEPQVREMVRRKLGLPEEVKT